MRPMSIGITGHQRSPDQALPFIEAHLADVVRTYRDLRCISSLAMGADQLFAQLALARGAALYVVIPSENYETTFATKPHLQQYQQLLQQATTTETMPFAQPSEASFLAAGKRVADLSDLLLAIWDGQAAQGKGGTADIVAYARQQGTPVVIAWPDGVKR